MMKKIAIIGAGNLGKAIANGLLMSNIVDTDALTLTRRNTLKLEEFKKKNINVTSNNIEAVENSDIIMLCIKPHKFTQIAKEIAPALKQNHILISTVTGIDINKITKTIGKELSIFRAMPNTAISIRESMTCLSIKTENQEHVKTVKNIFDNLGVSVIINDELMEAATILAASGIAFALRYIRASMQAGIEIGFESTLAQLIAAQTVKGASSLVLNKNSHPESEVDKVTTPLGVTITGLNKMEFNGFSSSVIQGVLSSYKKIK